jgi:hypothetical protein
MWRVLAYTVVISMALVGLRRLEVAAMLLVPPAALPDEGVPVGGLELEAAQVATASREALQRLPRTHRRAVFRLGYELGFASGLGGFALSQAKEQASTLAEQHMATTRGLANQLGVGRVDQLPIATVKDVVALTRRIESDDNGLAGRIERQLSLHHRHLYLLGMHIGKEAANVEMTQGEVPAPEESLIRHHATMTGIRPELWAPLASVPSGETPGGIVMRYRAAFAALDASLDIDLPSPK